MRVKTGFPKLTVSFALASAFLFAVLWTITAAAANLHEYVQIPLRDAARLCEQGKYNDSLVQLELVKAEDGATAVEKHYLKGLCFQGLGEFGKSIAEQQCVISDSGSSDLTKKARLGISAAELQSSIVSPTQTHINSTHVCFWEMPPMSTH